jgi:6,7-dimethyl-8-ribityllumazine synthase
MANVHEASLIGKGKKFGVVASRFNNFITARLLAGAEDALVRHGVAAGDIDVFWVPGSFEIPLTAQKLAEGRKYHAVICLGTILRGQTPHFDYIAAEAAKGVAAVGLKTGVPVIFGVITADTLEQAIDRAGAKGGNKGADAALVAIEMANLCESLGA